MTHPLHIDYIQPTPLALAVRESMYPTEHKGLKQWLGVIVAVAIPFVAPMISGAIAASGFLGATATGFFSTVGGSALVGAGIGGLSAAATGGDWKKGALMGGVGGYLGGAPKMGGAGTTAGPQGVEVVEQSYTTAADGTITPVDAAGTSTMIDPSTGAVIPATTPQNIAPTADSAMANKLDFVDPQNANTNFMGNTGTGGAGLKTPEAGSWESFKTKLSDKFSSDKLMDRAIDGGIQAGVNAAVGSQYSPEQLELQNQYKEEIARLEAQGAEVDQIKLAQAKELLQQAMQVDPVWLARQKANAEKNKAARATNNAVRQASLGYGSGSGNRTDAIRRRGKIQGSKASSSAYDAGYLGGIDQKTKLQTAGLSNLPGSTGLSGYYQQLGSMYQSDDERRKKEIEGWGDMFGNSIA